MLVGQDKAIEVGKEWGAAGLESVRSWRGGRRKKEKKSLLVLKMEIPFLGRGWMERGAWAELYDEVRGLGHWNWRCWCWKSSNNWEWAHQKGGDERCLEDLQSAQKPTGGPILGELPKTRGRQMGELTEVQSAWSSGKKGRVKNPEECGNHRGVITGRQEGLRQCT